MCLCALFLYVYCVLRPELVTWTVPLTGTYKSSINKYIQAPVQSVRPILTSRYQTPNASRSGCFTANWNLKGAVCHAGQKKRLKDSLKVISLKSFGIDTDSWQNQAQDHPFWRAALITKGSRTSEAKRSAEERRKREQRKTRGKHRNWTVSLISALHVGGPSVPGLASCINRLRTHGTQSSSV